MCGCGFVGTGAAAVIVVDSGGGSNQEMQRLVCRGGGAVYLCDERFFFEDQSGPVRSDWIVPVKIGLELHEAIQMRI